MKFQALLLSLVILVSILLSPVNKPPGESPEARVEPALASQELKLDNTFSFFIKDFYSVLSEKMNFIGQDLALAATNFNQNFVAVKDILSNNLRNFLAGSSEFSNESDLEFASPSAHALVSEIKINTPKIFTCKPDQSNFTGRVMLVKYLDPHTKRGFEPSAQDNNYPRYGVGVDPSTDSGQVIFEFNSKQRWPIASLTKLMTAIVAIEKMDLNKEVAMSERAVTTEGTTGKFQDGEVFRFRDLIKAILISSSNDAAAAIAETFGELRGERDFINEMQRKAAELKMFSTTYLEPTGLSFINQSTVSDLARLMNYIYLSHPEILEISRQKEAEILELKSNKPRKLLNVNKFAGEPDFIGGKTGYIDEAGRNLIALFNIEGKTILTIVLGAEDSFMETERLKEIIKNCQ